MPIYLWEGKVLRRSDFSNKIAAHLNCCCNAGPFCTYLYHAMYDCDLREWVLVGGAIVDLYSVTCTPDDQSTNWIEGAAPSNFTCPSNHTCCILSKKVSVAVSSCEISVPPGPSCATLTEPPLPAQPVLQDLIDHCPCYAQLCPGNKCKNCSRCYRVSITGVGSIGVMAQIWENADGTCNNQDCFWGNQVGPRCAGNDNGIECCDGVYVFNLGGQTWQKSATGCPPAGTASPYAPVLWPEIHGGPTLEVVEWDCDSFLIAGDGAGGVGGYGCGGLTDGDYVDLVAWEAAGCPCFFGTDGSSGSTGPHCFNICGNEVRPNYSFAPLSGNIKQFLSCDDCFGDPSHLDDGAYYIIDYEYYTTTGNCTGTSSTVAGVCVQYNTGQFYHLANNVFIGTSFGTCVDQGDSRSTTFWGLVPPPFGPYYNPSCV